MEEFKHILKPFKLGNLDLKNRIVMSAMLTNFATEEGFVTQQLIDYYAERAKGGAGLITIENTCVDSKIGRDAPNHLCIDDDKYIPGLEKLTNAIKGAGAKIAIQLNHVGNRAKFEITGKVPVSSSNVKFCLSNMEPRELSKKDIDEIVEKFAKGAFRAKEAGFDAVEIHCAHGYLICQFLSPYNNRRKDEYGGNLENRAKFALDIIHRTRDLVGNNYALTCKINAEEFMGDRGIQLEDSKYFAKKLEEAGVNAVTVSAGNRDAVMLTKDPSLIIGPTPTMEAPQACFLRLAEEIKKTIKLPIIAVGRINPAIAENIIKDGKADLVAMGRAFITDPYFFRKTVDGRLDDIRRCIGCNQCVERDRKKYPKLRCTVNAYVGKEAEDKVVRSEKGKKVMVIGGGPGGMETARIASQRGHRVMLYEQSSKLGGKMLMAARPPKAGEINYFIEYLVWQVKSDGVEMFLNKVVNDKVVEESAPDVIILAAGSRPKMPDIKGLRQRGYQFAENVLASEGNLGENVVIIGGGLVGAQTADYLAENGKKVVILEVLNQIASDAVPTRKELLMRRLLNNHVKVMTGVTVKEITFEGVAVEYDGIRETIAADSVVLAVGSEPNDPISESLKGRIPVYKIGDCVEPRKILEAVHEGAAIARRI